MQTIPVEPGQILAGKYRITRVLGRGGMGVVAAAEHSLLGHVVAIKVLLDTMSSDPSVVARFLREARASAQLRSDHIVRVTDVGELDSGAPFMVMELLEGQDLGQVLQTVGPVGIAAATDYVLQACHGVAEAHSRGIVHRDLKPANLFLTRRSDGSPLVKVLDFGISKSTLQQDASVTATGAQFGSPSYMSPEQLRNSKDVDGRSDVWALGMILFELLTGRTAFSGTTMSELFINIATEPPARLLEFRGDVPAELEAVVLRCLEKDPARRFESVDAFARALGQAVHRGGRLSTETAVVSLSQADVSSWMQTPGDTAKAFGTTHERTTGGRIGLFVGLGAVVLLSIGAVLFTLFRAQPTEVAQPTLASTVSASGGPAVSSKVVSAPDDTARPPAREETARPSAPYVPPPSTVEVPGVDRDVPARSPADSPPSFPPPRSPPAPEMPTGRAKVARPAEKPAPRKPVTAPHPSRDLFDDPQ